MELVDENQSIGGDKTASDGGTLPHPREVRDYLRHDQPRECPRNIHREERGEQAREKWYDQ